MSDIDAYVLTNGNTVSRMEGKSSKTVWSWNTDDIRLETQMGPLSPGSRSTPILSLHRTSHNTLPNLQNVSQLDPTRLSLRLRPPHSNATHSALGRRLW
ncbi:unnamed protein product [Rhizoctonia solani]|nr:unnamed protein product [Rhizoctonia solani]